MAAASAADAHPWQDLWAAWTRAAGTGAGHAATSATLERLTQGYREFGERVAALARGADGATLAGALAEMIESYARGSSAGEESGLDGLFGAVPAQFAAAQAGLGEGELERRLREMLFTWADQLLALPPIGPLRDWQAAVLSWQRAVLAEQRAAARVAGHLRQAHRNALQHYARWLRQDEGVPIETLRALYDAWIEQAEAAHAETVMSAPFATDFAAWANAGSAARTAGKALRERIAQTLDLPQRAEVDALLLRNRALEQALAGMRDAFAALEARVTLAVAGIPHATGRAAPVSDIAAMPAARVTAAPPAPHTAGSRPARQHPPRKRASARASAAPAVPRAKAPGQAQRRKPAARSPQRFDIGDIVADTD